MNTTENTEMVKYGPTVEQFVKIKELFSDPNNWYQGYWACNSEGQMMPWNSPGACRFCILGAMLREHEGEYYHPNFALLSEKSVEVFGLNSTVVNDRLGLPGVMQLLDACITSFEQEGTR